MGGIRIAVSDFDNIFAMLSNASSGLRRKYGNIVMQTSYRRATVMLGVVIAALITVGLSVPAVAQGVGAVVPLPAQMQEAAQKYLPGVVGEPVPAFTIDPSLATLSPSTRLYQLVNGPNAGNTEEHVIARLPEKTTEWRYTIGDRSVILQEVPGKSLSIISENDADQGVVTRYTPPEPLLIAGMNAGDTKKMTMQVNVFDLSDPTDLEHQGKLDVTLTYVGAYKVTVPAGTFDAALLRWEFNGKIGPASVEDIQARFVAPDVGMVAAAEKRDIAAFLIYNDNTKVGKVLAQKP
ncbi:MAG: hypothetical protein HWD60_12345 [Defluviicoccus sp.]|nr:MAG: hypothetical protein HWD60_12345 [Defluviicoccus sp.]